MVHHILQAEADRVFTPQDRAEAKKRKGNSAQIALDLVNEKQKFRRNVTKCALHWGEYNCASGTLTDLALWDVYATRAQLNLSKILKLEDKLERALDQ
jgi:hypothetical protein